LSLYEKQGISSIFAETAADDVWGIMAQRAIVTKIVSVNRTAAKIKISEFASRPLVTAPIDASRRGVSCPMGETGIRGGVVEEQGTFSGIMAETNLCETVQQFGWALED
jgi:predicted transcriptional regulator